VSAGRKVVVVGGGAAGMAAGLSAALHGADVTVLEASGVLGGTTVLSGGAIWVPGNPWAAAKGIDDNPGAALRYVGELAVGDTNMELVEAYVTRAADVIRGLEDVTAVRWEMQPGWPDYHAELPGGIVEGRALEIGPTQVPLEAIAAVRVDPYGVPPMTVNEERSTPPDAAELQRRVREGIVARGRGLIAALYAAFLDAGGRVVLDARGTKLVTAGGAVTGVEAAGRVFEGQVVITTGGFERDLDLVSTFLRVPVEGPAGPPTVRGDGLRMGMAVGAALGNMSEAWWCAALSVPGETLDGAPFHRMLFLDAAKPGGIVVDAGGRRFADEASNYNDFGRALHEFDPARFAFTRSPSWLIADARRRADAPMGPVLPGDPEPDWLLRAPSLEDLAGRIGLPAAQLVETVERFNRHVEAGVDADYGRGSFVFDGFSAGTRELAPIGDGPYYALPIVAGCLGTKGGLRIDPHGRVLRADGSGPIAGLHAAGNAAASPFGWAYPGPGSTIGPALVFGTAAGATAAA
jgi:succinate dehydrogenase/fumarate reductase flavoprotein subunit